MTVLAVETATPRLSVAIGDAGGIAGSFSAAAGRRHGETLAPAIALLRDATGVALAEIDRIAVDVGPGLFTGLRVGLATAAALGEALGIPAVGVCSLDLLAHPHTAERRAVAAVVDARRAEVFWALYLPGHGSLGELRRVGEPAVAAPADVAAALLDLGREVLVVGDGAARYADVLTGDGIEIRPAYPEATELVAMASGPVETVAPGQLRPLYLRQADVRIGWVERPAPAAP